MPNTDRHEYCLYSEKTGEKNKTTEVATAGGMPWDASLPKGGVAVFRPPRKAGIQETTKAESPRAEHEYNNPRNQRHPHDSQVPIGSLYTRSRAFRAVSGQDRRSVSWRLVQGAGIGKRSFPSTGCQTKRGTTMFQRHLMDFQY